MAHGGGGESSAVCGANGMFKKSHGVIIPLVQLVGLEKILLEKTVQKHSKEKKKHKCLEKTNICKMEAIIITDHCDAGKSEIISLSPFLQKGHVGGFVLFSHVKRGRELKPRERFAQLDGNFCVRWSASLGW